LQRLQIGTTLDTWIAACADDATGCYAARLGCFFMLTRFMSTRSSRP
jgi:hypothetical protein